MKKLKISIVSFANTLVFKHGIENNAYIKENSIIQYKSPAECATDLINNKADIALAPIEIINEINKYHKISDFGIVAKNKVDSVLLLAQEPIESLNKIYLDYNSLTSVKLFKILAKNHFKISPDYLEAEKNYEKLIKSKTGGIIIGDRALNFKNCFKYSYDLAEEWNKYTNLPMVFAFWIANKQIDKSYIDAFSSALKQGVDNINTVIQENKDKYKFDLEDYLLNKVSYTIGSKEEKSIKRFLTESY